jgi:hypothetical protein
MVGLPMCQGFRYLENLILKLVFFGFSVCIPVICLLMALCPDEMLSPVPDETFRTLPQTDDDHTITFFGLSAPPILAIKIHQIVSRPLNRAWNCRPLLVIVKDCRPYIKGSRIGSS